MTVTSREDVFSKVGEEYSVKPQAEKPLEGIGSARSYVSNFIDQVIGIAGRKLRYVKNDFKTIPLLLFPSLPSSLLLCRRTRKSCQTWLISTCCSATLI